MAKAVRNNTRGDNQRRASLRRRALRLAAALALAAPLAGCKLALDDSDVGRRFGVI